MKVVLFCGGLGTRLREHSDTIPKPLVNIGVRPIIWHLMRYYAYFGHKEFILCLGYRGELIREYFLNYNEALSNDFTMSDGGRNIELHASDIDDWRSQLSRIYAPMRLTIAVPDDAGELPGLLAERVPVEGETVAYRCAGTKCDLPVNTLKAVINST